MALVCVRTLPRLSTKKVYAIYSWLKSSVTWSATARHSAAVDGVDVLCMASDLTTVYKMLHGKMGITPAEAGLVLSGCAVKCVYSNSMCLQ